MNTPHAFEIAKMISSDRFIFCQNAMTQFFGPPRAGELLCAREIGGKIVWWKLPPGAPGQFLAIAPDENLTWMTPGK